MAVGRFHRLLWSSIYIVLLFYTIWVVLTLGQSFLDHPTVTTMTSSSYPVSKIPFPAISICSINKVSKKRAFDLASLIANTTGHSLEKMMEYMKFFGQLHDWDFDPSTVTQLLEFQSILDVLGISVIDAIKNLSIPCDELLWKCYWRNEQVPCSSIFSTRLTYQGYCCVFNYRTEFQSVVRTTDAGVEPGLYVSITNYPNDYFYTVLSSPGIMSFVFPSTDYPDKQSGALTEILTKPNSENFIEIVPTVLTAVSDVANYPVIKVVPSDPKVFL